MNNGGRKSVTEQAKDKAFEGLKIHIGELQRRDGEITEAVRQSLRTQGQGVIQTLITAETDENYRQIILRARWENKKQRRLFMKAIGICARANAKWGLRLLLDVVTADTAGDNGIARREAGEWLTHQSIAFREDIERKKKREHKSASNSPIA